MVAITVLRERNMVKAYQPHETAYRRMRERGAASRLNFE
jgi:hypothetical protein